jgi:hypothetical protein
MRQWGMTFLGAGSASAASSYEAFEELLKLHQDREWRALVNRGDALLVRVASARDGLELRPHAEAICADAMIHHGEADEGLDRLGLALAIWPETLHPQARTTFGSRFVSHAMHAGRYEPARREAQRIAERALPSERSAAWRMLAMIAWDTLEPLATVDDLLERSFTVDRLTDHEQANAQGRALFYQCQFRCMVGEGEQAWAVGRHLLEHLDGDARRTPPPSSDRSRWVDRGASLRSVAWAAALAGDLPAGRALFDRSEAESEAEAPARQPALDVARARVWRSLGEPDEASTCAKAAIAGGIEHDRAWPQAAGHRELGLLAIDRADHVSAMASLEAALDLFRRLHNPRDEHVTADLLKAARPQLT